MLDRRGFFSSLAGALIAAPAVIRTPKLLMPVRVIEPFGACRLEYLGYTFGYLTYRQVLAQIEEERAAMRILLG